MDDDRSLNLQHRTPISVLSSELVCHENEKAHANDVIDTFRRRAPVRRRSDCLCDRFSCSRSDWGQAWGWDRCWVWSWRNRSACNNREKCAPGCDLTSCLPRSHGQGKWNITQHQWKSAETKRCNFIANRNTKEAIKALKNWWHPQAVKTLHRVSFHWKRWRYTVLCSLIAKSSKVI